MSPPIGRSTCLGVFKNKINNIYQSVVEREYAHVPAVVYVVAAHHRVGVVFHPNAGQRVSTDFVVLERPLRVIGDVDADVLAIADVAMVYPGIGAGSANAHGGAHDR